MLPALATGALKARIVNKLATDDVTVNIHQSPAALMLVGRLDHLEAVAHQGKIGQVYVKELTLTGDDVVLNTRSLYSDGQLTVDRAKSLELKGIIDEENLREVLARKIDKVENVQVAIDPNGVLVTANAKIFGRTADIELAGTIVEDSGSLYFQMTRLDIRNTRLGTARLGDLFGNIQLAAAASLPLGLRVKNVDMGHGTIIVTADNK